LTQLSGVGVFRLAAEASRESVRPAFA